MLGLKLIELAEAAGGDVPAEVIALADERVAKRAEKDFAASDELRDKIKDLGYEVLDGPDGYTLEKI